MSKEIRQTPEQSAQEIRTYVFSLLSGIENSGDSLSNALENFQPQRTDKALSGFYDNLVDVVLAIGGTRKNGKGFDLHGARSTVDREAYDLLLNFFTGEGNAVIKYFFTSSPDENKRTGVDIAIPSQDGNMLTFVYIPDENAYSHGKTPQLYVPQSKRGAHVITGPDMETMAGRHRELFPELGLTATYNSETHLYSIGSSAAGNIQVCDPMHNFLKPAFATMPKGPVLIK